MQWAWRRYNACERMLWATIVRNYELCLSLMLSRGTAHEPSQQGAVRIPYTGLAFAQLINTRHDHDPVVGFALLRYLANCTALA
jgi:hypothetical protein